MQNNNLGKVMAFLACVAPESQLRLILELALAVEVNSVSDSLKQLVASGPAGQKNGKARVEQGLDILLDLIVADGEFSETERNQYVALMDRLGQRRQGRWGVPFNVVKEATLDKLSRGMVLEANTKRQLYNFIGVDKVKGQLKRLAEIKSLDIQQNTLNKIIAFLACVAPEGQLRILLELALAIGVRETKTAQASRIRGLRSLESLRRLSCDRLENYVQKFRSLPAEQDYAEKNLDILLDLIAADGWLSGDEDSHLKTFSDRIVQDETLQQKLRHMMGEIGRVETSSAARAEARQVLKQVGFFDRIEQELETLTWIE